MKNVYIVVCQKREINTHISCNYMIYGVFVFCLLFLFLRHVAVDIDTA